MALNSILEITYRACDELGIPRPGTTGLVASSAPSDRQILALLHAAGGDLLREHNWSNLITTAAVTLATASVSYALPSDFERLVPGTGWDRTNQFPLEGNIPVQRHQFWLSSAVVAPVTRKEFRLFVGNNAGTIYVHPAPTAADSLSYLYISKNWLTNSVGASAADTVAADTDLTLFKPELMVKELKWRWRSAKGLDATVFKIEADNLRDTLIARDQASSWVDQTGTGPLSELDTLIPDSGWNL